jgi:hypothetical protein
LKDNFEKQYLSAEAAAQQQQQQQAAASSSSSSQESAREGEDHRNCQKNVFKTITRFQSKILRNKWQRRL